MEINADRIPQVYPEVNLAVRRTARRYMSTTLVSGNPSPAKVFPSAVAPVTIAASLKRSVEIALNLFIVNASNLIFSAQYSTEKKNLNYLLTVSDLSVILHIEQRRREKEMDDQKKINRNRFKELLVRKSL